jgi:hypothetical protein
MQIHHFMKRTIVILAIFSVVLSCEKQEIITERPYPRLDISEEVIQNDTAAIFKASFLTQSGEILDRGFVWGQGTFPPIESSPHTSLGPGYGDGSFSGSALDLFEGKEYLVYAYARTPERIVYSQAVGFLCTANSHKFQVEGFHPASGYAGETVVLKGVFPIEYEESFQVYLGDETQVQPKRATIKGSTAKTITIQMPFMSNHSQMVPIKVIINGVSKTFMDEFQYLYEKPEKK